MDHSRDSWKIPDITDDSLVKLMSDDSPEWPQELAEHKISLDESVVMKEVLGRCPTYTELGIFSAMWSEHCSYKSSRVHLRRLPSEGKDVVIGPGENAGVVRLTETLCAVFKMESHNHPSFIEPYQGAATGVGGIMRDVFCMGARPVANLNALRFGEPDAPRMSYLKSHVVQGIGDYGNCVGVPTVGGNVGYDKSYNGNILVNAMTVGICHEREIFTGLASGVGNWLIYAGSATGRDGIHGATMASDSFSQDSSESRTTVQVGDPFAEKILIEVTIALLEAGLVVGLQDMGAAGLASSSFEMADRAGTGLVVDLDRVPMRAENMTAYELMLSESQERMLYVIKPENWPKVAEILKKWELSYDVIGEVIEEPVMKLFYQGALEAMVPIAPITAKAPKYERPLASPPKKTETTQTISLSAQQCSEVLEKIIRRTGGKEKIFSQYDRHIGNKTHLTSDHEGSAVVWLRADEYNISNKRLGLHAVAACLDRYCASHSFIGSEQTVAKAARMIFASGGSPLAVTDCLNFGNPEDPVVMRQFSDAIDGIANACKELSIPVVSGNVSLYNETDGSSINPTPMIGMIGKSEDIDFSVAAATTKEADLYLLNNSESSISFNSSFLAMILSDQEALQSTPDEVDWTYEREASKYLASIAKSKSILACRDVGDGGVAAAVSKLTSFKGFEAQPEADFILNSESAMNPAIWLADFPGAYVIAMKPGSMVPDSFGSLKVSRIGRTTSNAQYNFGKIVISADQLDQANTNGPI